ncbi:Hint domain-containing protein [Pseudoalteromonas luteoviolacea]|uniref:Hint domain-containing protein n=1 Tax=Pseudoalteromonas luteoviolacea TaxID=43657 RepID=UPI001153C746|nr:Hint domain-containing protein [Pseudoalteromonas luteoviolacea]TQF70994.1 hypothetical protein FLM44_07875 [Pseudoalteromonas luteoviolacea]
MKLSFLALTVSSALAFGSVAAFEQPITKKVSTPIVQGLNVQQGVQYVDPDSKEAIAEMEKIFKEAGWNEKNSPQLFKELNTPQAKIDVQDARFVRSYNSSDTTEAELESYFSHLGFNIVGEGASKLFKIRLLNAEPKATNLTILSIKLVNEKGEQITTQQTARFFGDGGSNLNRKVLGGEATVESAYEHVSRAKEVYGKGTAYVMFADGTKVLKKIDVKYDKHAILGMLAKELGLPINNRPANAPMVMAKAGFAEAAGGVGIAQFDAFQHVVDHPRDFRKADANKQNVAGQDGVIMVCLNRDYGDCDYPMVQAGGDYNNIPHVTIPFKGSITLPTYISRVLFKEDDVLGAQNVPPTDVMIQSKEAFHDKLSLHNPNMKAKFEQYFTIDYRFDQATWSPVTTLTWDIPREAALFARPGIFQRRADAYWIMNIALEVNWMGNLQDAMTYFGATEEEYNYITGFTSYIIASEEAPELPKDMARYDQAPLQFSFSCLAKGTQILMPNKQSKAVETFNVGDLVLGASEFEPDNTEVLKVVDVSVGVEHLPMVKLTTELGQTLTLTESHPLVREGGKAVWALNVAEGDVIQTAKGPAKITKFEKVDYKDNVYNLKLARVNGKQDAGETFVMFANGVSVGDLAMQTENELDTHKETVEEVLQRIPQEWHADYLNSLETK